MSEALFLTATITRARSKFPAGLAQALGCRRFDLSALLLGQYVAQCNPDQSANLVELGTGCGAAACQLLLLRPDLKIWGLEIIPEQAKCARQNAANLGLENFQVVTGDLGDPGCLRHLRIQAGSAPQQQVTVVFCNPPWLLATDGRPSPNPRKNLACRGGNATIALFFQAADSLLCQGGSLICIVAAEYLTHALHSLPDRLRPENLRLIHQNPEQRANFAVFRAIKKKKAALLIERPWFLPA